MMRIALVAAVVAVVVASAAATSIGEANLWASNFGDQMVNLTETELRVVELQDLFNSGYTASQAVDGGDLADQLRTSLEQLVSDKRDAVLALKTAIEDSYAAAASTCTDPVRDTTQPNSLPPLTWHENFKTVVNTDYTSIRFADGISQLDFDVDDDICRSLPAEQVMIDNFANDPTLKWQYFGSDNGVFRQFPAKEWSKTGGVYNAYDNRFRPWYVASSAGPKDVVIILDTSGSMQIAGRLELAKDAVDSVLGTLTPNDFVNLVTFNTAAEQLTPCLPDTLYRATPAVIDHLRDEVANLNHGGRTNFVDAFDVAFDLFDASSERTTECQKAILFLTDGEADSPIERIAERQGAHDVKIFSFALGSEADIEVPREVACSNAGIFSAIDDGDGDLRTQMASYYQYFAAGIENELTWSSPYFDASGLGIVTTLAAPCYKRTVTPYEIVGVVGVDVAIDQFTQEVYNFQSANSYAFMINNQGDVMTHPRFSDPGSIDSAIYVDIADLESADSDFLTNVRRPMVRRDDGSYEMTVNRVIPRGDARYDGVRTKAIQTEYHFRPVDGSPFSVAYALSNYDKIGYALPLQSSDVVDDSYYHEFTLLPSADSTAVNAAVQGSGAKLEGLLVSYDRSCFKGAPSSYTSPNNYIFGIENSATVANIQTWANTNSGNAGFRSPILRELRRTVPMEDLWKDNHGPGTLWQYFGTKNGFIRKYPGSPYLTKEYDPTQRTWYRRSVSYPVDTALSTPYLDASGAGQVITLSKAIFEGAVHSGPFTDSDPVAGVAGMDFSYETFEDIFLQTVPCPGTSRCWLMDYSGYLVTYDTFLGASNPATFENVFIGEREKPFFDRMLADQFFVRQDFENYETFESCFYYEVDLDAFPSGYSATVSGAGCRSGTIYAVAVPNTQVYLIAIDNYSSSGICATEVPSCTPFNYDVCQSDSLDENRVATIQCPDFELSDTQLENLRGDEPCNAAGGAVTSVLAVILAALVGLVLSA